MIRIIVQHSTNSAADPKNKDHYFLLDIHINSFNIEYNYYDRKTLFVNADS
ncbi:hypothetical protein H8E88_12060 [candidate division KSB1 bacterium]|nr:hypothetical protein [candidate division KSB1 bacterium]MBL7095168.1 hypothetical protein [candidate division KSB1 bacterium]